jgi:cytochrome c oxidase subunit 3
VANEPDTPYQHYYVPEKSYWPFIGAIGLATTLIGGVRILHGEHYGKYIFLLGALIMAGMLYGWFHHIIEEDRKGLYSQQMDRSFRWGMVWFIFSEIMFFAAFFGALFYVRHYLIYWLANEGGKLDVHDAYSNIWPHFKAVWPLLVNPNPSQFPGPSAVINPWGLPALNTLLLLTSGVTITIAHHALKDNRRRRLMWGLGATILLGLVFLCVQAYEYHHAYTELGLTLASGIYGTTFFMLTGFHGAHVTIGCMMLIVMFIRSMKGHFTPERHFGFEAAAWYWHFVDVVWLFLFIFVYWL